MGKQKQKPRLRLVQCKYVRCKCDRCVAANAAAGEQIKERIRSFGLRRGSRP